MEDLDRLIALRDKGLCSEGLGPEPEWDPVSPAQHQVRHTRFWAGVVAPLVEDEPGDYEDLPDWMTETATEALADN